MKVNKYLLGLLVIMMISMLTACGGDNGTTASSGSDGNASTEPVTLKFWSALDPSSDQGKMIKQKVKEFDDSHDNINIDLQVISYDVLHDKLVASINAGDAPDISWGLGEWFGEFNKLDALADLTDDFNEWSDKDNMYSNVMESLTVDNRIKALPNYLGIRALLYHENILKEAGMNTPPKTWDELLNAAQTVKDKTGKEIFGIAGKGVRSSQELMMYLAQNDVNIAEKQADGKFKNTWLDNPDQLTRATEVFQFYQDLVNKNAIKSDARTWGWEEEDQNFVLGQYAMVINGTWIEGRASENPEGMKDVKIAAPVYKAKPATFMEIAPLFIYKSKYPKETFEFAKFLMGEDYQKAVNPSNSPRSDVIGDGWGNDFMALAEQGVTYPTVSLGGITKSMEDSIALALLKKEKPEEVAKQLSNAINVNLKKTGELSEN
ncbi:ABC transporter substrate-binding protein [Paenibacillus sp.]